MHATGKSGAGMSNKPRHHVMPQEERKWFQDRGFEGGSDIDNFCVEMTEADHQAVHGGGNWKLGRTWPGEWNQSIMRELRSRETAAGRMLTAGEILRIVVAEMKDYKIPVVFIHWKD